MTTPRLYTSSPKYARQDSPGSFVDALYNSRRESSSWDTDTTHTTGTPVGDASTSTETSAMQSGFGRYLGESDHSDMESETSMEFDLRTTKETFHLEDSWMIVPPEEEVVFGTDSSSDDNSDEGYTAYDSNSSEGDVRSAASCSSQEEEDTISRIQSDPSIEDSILRTESLGLFGYHKQQQTWATAEISEDEASVHESGLETFAQDEEAAKVLKVIRLDEERKLEAEKLAEEEERMRTEAAARIIEAMKLENEQRKAEKLAEEERKRAEAEAKALEAKITGDERRRCEAEALVKEQDRLAKAQRRRELEEQRLAEEERRRAIAEAKALAAKIAEEKRLQRDFEEKKRIAEEEKWRVASEAKALEAKIVEEGRRQRARELEEEKRIAEEERLQREREAKAVQAKIMEENRRQGEVEAKALEAKNLEGERLAKAQAEKFEEEKRQRDAKANALEAEKLESVRKQQEADAKMDQLNAKILEEEKREREVKTVDIRRRLFETDITVENTKLEDEKQPESKTKVQLQDEGKAVTAERQAVSEEANNDRKQIEARAKTASMVSSLAMTAVAVGLAAVGSRIDGNIKLSQSQDMLELGIVIDTQRSVQALKDISKSTLDSMDIDIQRSIQGLRDISKNTIDNIDIDIKSSIQSLRDTWKNTLDNINSDKYTPTSPTKRMIGNLAVGMAATPAACMVGSLASTAVSVGLAAVGSRIDGNIKVCQSPGKLHLGIVIDRV